MANSVPAVLQLAFVKKGSATAILVELLRKTAGLPIGGPKINIAMPKRSYPDPTPKANPVLPPKPSLGSKVAPIALGAAGGAAATGGAAALMAHGGGDQAAPAVVPPAEPAPAPEAAPIAPAPTGPGTKMVDGVKEVGSGVKQLGTETVDKVKQLGGEAVDKAKQLGGEALDAGKGGLSAVGNGLKDAGNWMGDYIKSFKSPVNEWGAGQWGGIGAVGLLALLLAHHLGSSGRED